MKSLIVNRSKPYSISFFAKHGVNSAYFFILPALVFYILFMAYPILYSFWLSLYDYDPFGSQKFIALRNYQVMFTLDPIFSKSLIVTIMYTIETAVGQTLLGLLAAVWVAHSLRTRTFYRLIYFLPVVIPLAMCGWIWAWMANPQIGLFDHILKFAGINLEVALLANPPTALPVVAGANNWHWAGMTMVVYLAAYQNIPSSLFESADLDGAGPLSKFRYITLPQLNTATIINVLLTTAGSFQAFDLPFVMTKGGPNFNTYTLGLYIYDSAFQYYRVGYAAALSVLMFFAILLVSMVYLRIGKIAQL